MRIKYLTELRRSSHQSVVNRPVASNLEVHFWSREAFQCDNSDMRDSYRASALFDSVDFAASTHVETQAPHRRTNVVASIDRELRKITLANTNGYPRCLIWVGSLALAECDVITPSPCCMGVLPEDDSYFQKIKICDIRRVVLTRGLSLSFDVLTGDHFQVFNKFFTHSRVFTEAGSILNTLSFPAIKLCDWCQSDLTSPDHGRRCILLRLKQL